ncbi:helix-loop-helix DNA-binding domain-containing protein [Emericellopsis atlantica]|uniref:Helix-loop-helix DNA-binding domain-containing protein n=1 Tax=Emericellopsis atlantica TaxID=2614577 RepID=A0A9P8CQU7_9HYPO|nr:helix-loop-helix DNA-binding domain-containing protein [Emericellopsis atlantica]KAG9254086.1 helix-loop-helix DNA-binding domain-containing protein [Emericellopsis atlantica]
MQTSFQLPVKKMPVAVYDSCLHHTPCAPTAFPREKDSHIGVPLFQNMDFSQLPLPLLQPLSGLTQDAVQSYPVESYRHEPVAFPQSGAGDGLPGYASQESTPVTPMKTTPHPRNKAHNMIEKRYRTNLNEKIAELRDAVPDLRAAHNSPERGSHNGSVSPQRLNKATILTKAAEYIAYLEGVQARLARDNMYMRRLLNVQGADDDGWSQCDEWS